MYYLELLNADLLYGNVGLDGTPVLGCSKVVKSQSGKIGYHFKESPQGKALSRWRDGHFLESEKELAAIWRDKTKNEDILINLREILQSEINLNGEFTSIFDLNKFIDDLLSNQATQQELLMFIIDEFGVNAESATSIFFRWSQYAEKNVQEFSPYALYCAKVKMLFELSLKYDLIGTRSTNLLDLQYFYYLPFTKLFSSNDKFQKQLIPYLLRSDQGFINGEELKKDLSLLVAYRKTLSDTAAIKRTQNEPPHLPESLTYKLWNKYFDWPTKYNRTITKESQEKNKRLMDEFITAEKLHGNAYKKNDGVEFIVRHHLLRPTDFCVCGSGKQLQECCYPKEKMQ